MIGSRLGKYEILSKLGEGGMGQVWRARDEQLHRDVALKILPAELSRDPGRRARFEQEARVLAALNHPNIVTVYEFGYHPDDAAGQAFLVSELVDGESLRTLMDRGRVPARRAIEIATQIAEGMAAAHAAGIVHRDLKPENIMLTASSGAVKILDFGLAKQTIAQAPQGATVTMGAVTTPGAVMGTVGYMSPEQVRGVNTDHRSDIFSFGVILHEMLAGQRAFQADSQVETMNAILHADPPELPVDASIPPALATIVRRCLEKKPEQRFQSAADLAFALRSMAGTTNAISGVQAALPPQPAPKRSALWLWPIAAVIAGAALFAGGFYLRDRTLQHDPPAFQRLTFRRGLIRNARFSPDGRNVVYTANWDGAKSHTFLSIPGDPESRDLNLPEDSKVLAVSSNSEVAFVEPPSGVLARVSISGGQMRPQLDNVLDADWSPDGSSLAVIRIVDGKGRVEYPIGKVLYTGAGKYPYFAIRISPDNKRIAYATYAGNGSQVGIGVIDLPNGMPHILGVVSGQTVMIDAPALSWTPDSSEIWFRSFNPDEGGTLYGIDLKGRKRVVHRFPSHADIFDIARDGRVLLRTESTELGILGKGPNDKAERDLSILESGILEGISDDGSMIAASVTGDAGGPKGSIYTRKLDGSAPIRVGDGHAFTLSPDGKWISGYTVIDGAGMNRQFRLLPTGPGEERPMDLPGMTFAVPFAGVGDEQYIIVGLEKGKQYPKSWRCYFWDSRTNALRPVCPEGIPDDMMYVSPDRKWLLSQAPGGSQFALYPIDGGEPKIVPGFDPKKEFTTGWRSDSQSVYVMQNTRPGPWFKAESLNVFTGQRTPALEVHPSRPVDEVEYLRITPDGRAYAYNYNVRLTDLYVASGLK